MRKIISGLLLLGLMGCVSPSPQAQAPVNIRVFCGEDKDKLPAVAPDVHIDPSPSPSVVPEEWDRFWYWNPPSGSSTTPLYPGPSASKDSITTPLLNSKDISELTKCSTWTLNGVKYEDCIISN